MKTETRSNRRILAGFLAVLLTFIALSPGSTMMDLSRLDVDTQTVDDVAGNAFEPVEDTKYYHDRGQNSFDNAVDIGDAIDDVMTAAAADLDNDGDIDLVTAGEAQPGGPYMGALQIWENTGNPFESPSTWNVFTIGGINQASPTQCVYTSVDVGDIDNDGDLDIVTGNDRIIGWTVQVYRNPLSGGALPWAPIPAWGPDEGFEVGSVSNDYVTDVAVGDFDNDGDLDIVTGDGGSGGGNIGLWRNDRNPFGGAWPGPFNMDAGDPSNGHINSFDVGDVDNDGDLDVVSAEGIFTTGADVAVEIWQNPMPIVDPFTGSWSGGVGVTISPWGSHVDSQTAPLSVKFGDMDNDGDLDVLAGGDGGSSAPNLEIIENPGRPFAAPWTPISLGGNSSETPVYIGDMDNDGWLDFISNLGSLPTSPVGSFGVMLRESKQDPFNTYFAGFYLGSYGGNFNLMADLDNDGDLDVVTGDTNSLTDIYAWNNTLIHRNMPFRDSIAVDVTKTVNDIDVGDIDNDGDLDVATAHYSEADGITLKIASNNEPWVGTSWAPVNDVETALNDLDTSRVKMTDLDNDGDLDIASITSIPGSKNLYVWENPLETSDPFTGPWSGGVGVLVGRLGFPDMPAFLDTADLDNDGDIDIATHFFNSTSSVLEVRIWRNPHNETGDPFIPGWLSNTIGVPPIGFSLAVDIATGDLENDGDIDIITSDSSAEIVIWENLNSTGLDPWIVPWSAGSGVQIMSPPNPGNPKIVPSDLDNDGDLDVVYAFDLSFDVAFLINPNDASTLINEPFTIVPWQQLPIGFIAPNNFLSIEAGDIDNDGDDDLVTGDFMTAGPVQMRHVIVWTNPLTEVGGLSNIPWKYDEYFKSESGGGVTALALGDLDKGNNTGNNKAGDLDIVHNIGNAPTFFVMENVGAQVTELLTPKSTPPSIYNIFDGAEVDLMTINATHNGVWSDNNAELHIWRFYFDDDSSPLTTGEAQALFSNLHIYRDANGDENWQPFPTDEIVATIPGASISLNGGFQTFMFADPDPAAVIPADESEFYFLVAEVSGTASSATPNTFNVTFDPDGYSSGNWNEVEHEVGDKILTVLYSITTTAGIFRAISGMMPDVIPGNLPIPTNIEVDGIPVTGATGSPPISDRVDVPAGTIHPISSVVTNIGSVDTGITFNATFYNCTTSGMAIDPPFHTVTLGPLAPGASSLPTQRDWTAPMATGQDRYVCLFVDSEDQLAELFENNNLYIIHFYTIEDIPPEVSNVLIDGAPTQTYSVCALPPTINLTATIDDSNTGNSNIGGANYTVMAFGWPGLPMSIAFPPTSPTEEVYVVRPTPTSVGTYTLYVYGWDVRPNYNTTSTENATLNIIDDCPPLVQNVRLNGQLSLAVAAGDSVTVTAILNDTTTGNSNILRANYTIGIENWPGAAMNAVIAPFDNPLEDVVSVPDIDTTGWATGLYDICVYGSDVLGNNNTTGECAVLSVAPELVPPEIHDVLVSGANPQTFYLSSLPATFALTATINDTNTGGSFIGTAATGGANYTLGPANWPSSQPMNAVDGTWEDDIAEDVVLTMPVPTTPGTYVYCVYGWDQWLNYNTTGACATLNIVDDIPPEISNVLLDGVQSLVVVAGTPSADLAAVLDETNTGQANIGGANYTIGIQAWGTSVTLNPTDGAWDEVVEDAEKTIDISAWTVGVYQICVYGWDSAVPRNDNVTGRCAQLMIDPAPDDPPAIEAWEPGGSAGQTYVQGTAITVTWTASDDNPLPANPINITYGDQTSGWIDLALNEANDGTYTWDTSSVPCGTYWMNVSVHDSIGQTSFDEGNNSFNIVCPTEPPVIVSVVANPDPQTVGKSVTITAVVADEDTLPNLLAVNVEIRIPTGTVLGNFTMTYDQDTDTFIYSHTFDLEGSYSYTVWAVDPDNNSDSESDTFKMNAPSAREYNWKPLLALVFTLILLLLGILVSHRRPIALKGHLQKDRMYTFLLGVLPFVIAEAATGIISLFTGLLSIPPIMGIGLVVDLAILFAGLFAILLILRKGKPAATYAEEPITPESPSVQPVSPTPADEETTPQVREAPQSTDEVASTKPCINCGKRLQMDYVVCPHCGTTQNP